MEIAMKDKQPRAPSKAGAPLDKLHPASDMGKRAKSGEKVNNPGVARRKGGPDQAGVSDAGRKPR
jgi:hypothetical protein